MSQGYSAMLTRCMLVSAVSLLAGAILPIPPILPLIVGFLPLIWYHLAYLKPQAGDGVSQPAVDSVYYFGFLITIGALGATALRLGLHGVEGSFTDVAMQFGLGLLATGYAVWARMQLTASSTMLDEANLEEAMNKYVERSRELVNNVELASSSFKAYAESVIANSEEFTRKIHGEAHSEIKYAAEMFRNAISGLVEEGKTSLQALRAVVNDVTFTSEREELKRSVTSMTQTVTTLTTTLDALKASLSQGAASIGDFASGLGSVGDRARDAADRLGHLGDANGILPKIEAVAQDCRIRFDELSRSVEAAAATVTSFSSNMTETATTATEFGAQAGKAVRSMREVASVSTRVNGLLESLTALERHFQKLSGASGETGISFVGMTAQVEELKAVLANLNIGLIDSTGGLKDAMLSISEELEGRLRQTISTLDRHARDISDSAHGMTAEPIA